MVLTKDDFEAMEDLMGAVVDEKIQHLVTKDDIKHLPTKDEFYKETARIYKKLDNIDEKLLVTNHQVRRNTQRIEKLENKAGIVAS